MKRYEGKMVLYPPKRLIKHLEPNLECPFLYGLIEYDSNGLVALIAPIPLNFIIKGLWEIGRFLKYPGWSRESRIKKAYDHGYRDGGGGNDYRGPGYGGGL
jgi:hypothetical protein